MIEGLGLLGMRKEAGYKKILRNILSEGTGGGDTVGAARRIYSQRLDQAHFDRFKKLLKREDAKLTARLKTILDDPTKSVEQLENHARYFDGARKSLSQRYDILNRAKEFPGGELGGIYNPETRRALFGSEHYIRKLKDLKPFVDETESYW